MEAVLAQQYTSPTDDRVGLDILRSRKISVVLGGVLDETARREVREGKRPRVDVLEMESRFQARVIDFGRLVQEAKSDRRARFILGVARRTGLWSPCLAYYALGYVKDDDLVYATGEDVGLPLAMMLRRLRAKRPRLLVRLEQPTYGRNMLRRMAFNVYMRAALRGVDMTICRTTAHVQYLNSLFQIPMSSLSFAAETTDPVFFSRSAPMAPVAPDLLPPEPYIVSAGLEMRDYPTLIDAVRGLPVHAVIGAGSPWSQVRFSHNGTSPPNVRVGSFTAEQMRELYRRAAFVVVPVQPTLRACGMNVVLEGWAMEKGVIVTRTIGQLDYTKDNETVLFVHPNDVEDMRSKIVYLLEHPEEAQRLGHNGRSLVEKSLNLDRFLDGVQRQTIACLS
jgi:glycosyltransferase involved in cell wall biosynthesis